MFNIFNLRKEANPNIKISWVNITYAIVTSIDFYDFIHLCFPHLFPTKLTAVSSTPMVKTPLIKSNIPTLYKDNYRVTDIPHNKYKGVNEINESFSSAKTENPTWRNPPIGSKFKILKSFSIKIKNKD